MGPVRPLSWLSFKGELSRLSFWMFYLGFCIGLLALMLAAALLSALAQMIFPPLGYMVDLGVFAGLVFAILCLAGAMRRRLRDAGRRGWPVPVATLSLCASLLAIILEGVLYKLNLENGTLDVWITTRWPVSEAIILIGLVSNFALLRGLIAPTAKAAAQADDAPSLH